MPQQSDIAAADQGDWRMLLLKAYGAGFQANAARCPLLWSLIADSPLIVSASLSFLSPRKHIPRHRGPFRGIFRFYMGLSVPTDDSGGPGTVLQIDGVDYRLSDGEALLWDDTYPHEVWNHANAVRVALLLDVRRADLPPDLNLLSRSIIAAVGCWLRARGVGGSDVPMRVGNERPKRVAARLSPRRSHRPEPDYW
jgi:aspartate beta-hydroxylase